MGNLMFFIHIHLYINRWKMEMVRKIPFKYEARYTETEWKIEVNHTRTRNTML